MTAQPQLDIDHAPNAGSDELLQQRIGELIDHCDQLSQEVVRLRAQRSHLITQNEEARMRVEAMLEKLRALQLVDLGKGDGDA